MKFQPDRAEGVNLISRHEPGRVWVQASAHVGALVVPWRGQPAAWALEAGTAPGRTAFEALLAFKPEVVVYGSGARIVFPAHDWLRALYAARIGVETMDTAAACRTYNVLAAEGRAVVAALLPAC
jgi:uncharacterized protein